jgi:sugar phosphate isomerase/epimerase
MATTPIALQLYTVRDALNRDLQGTLNAVREAGYTHVELAGTHGRTVAKFKKELDQAGLAAMSAHIPFDDIVKHTERVLKEAQVLGIDYVVVPWLGGETYSTRSAWVEAVKKLDAAGAAFREAGVCLCYHNHAHEFVEVEAARIYDLLVEHAGPENLAFQMDVCWAAVAGEDVLAMMRALTGRLPMLHLKDYAPGNPPSLTELGQGCIPWDDILAVASEAGVRWNIVEQDDNFSVDCLDSARAGAQFMLNRGA